MQGKRVLLGNKCRERKGMNSYPEYIESVVHGMYRWILLKWGALKRRSGGEIELTLDKRRIQPEETHGGQSVLCSFWSSKNAPLTQHGVNTWTGLGNSPKLIRFKGCVTIWVCLSPGWCTFSCRDRVNAAFGLRDLEGKENGFHLCPVKITGKMLN